MSAKSLIIAVGSMNPVKINAVQNAFSTVWSDKEWQAVGVKVDSGVSDQPMTDSEAIAGAKNRANLALKAVGDAVYGVGLEGGLQPINNQWFDGGWIVVVDREDNEGIGSTVRVHTPKKIMNKIRDGIELGDAIDQLFGGENLRQKEGHFGIMTNNVVTRTKGYTDGVVMALARFLQPEVF